MTASVGRSQLRNNTPHTGSRGASRQPGKSDQLTGTDTLMPGSAGLGKACATEPDGTEGEGKPLGTGREVGLCAMRLAQLMSIPTMPPIAITYNRRLMWLILLEALGAGLLLVLIVWWTMFSGRKDLDEDEDKDPPAKG
jgi:hypothetical protein